LLEALIAVSAGDDASHLADLFDQLSQIGQFGKVSDPDVTDPDVHPGLGIGERHRKTPSNPVFARFTRTAYRPENSKAIRTPRGTEPLDSSSWPEVGRATLLRSRAAGRGRSDYCG